MKFSSQSSEHTRTFGVALGRRCRGGEIFACCGRLGAGKTVLIKGLGRGLGIPEQEISSPTFTLLQIYPGRLTLFHYDIYRLDAPACLADLGFWDYLSDRSVTVIEWADKAEDILPPETIWVEILHTAENRREILLRNAHGRFVDALPAGG